jgi:hypothetical protein
LKRRVWLLSVHYTKIPNLDADVGAGLLQGRAMVFDLSLS